MEIYHFATHWFFHAPIERVWAIGFDVTRWPQWWSSWKQVTFRANQTELKEGSVVDLKLRAPMGYSFSFSTLVTTFQPPNCFELRSTGDLVGTGKAILTARDGGTAVDYSWDVSTSSWVFNLIAKFPFVRRVFEENHNAVMAAGERGLQAQLGEKVY